MKSTGRRDNLMVATCTVAGSCQPVLAPLLRPMASWSSTHAALLPDKSGGVVLCVFLGWHLWLEAKGGKKIKKIKGVYFFENQNMYFCVLTVEYMPVKVMLSLITVLLHCVFGKTVGPFAIQVHVPDVLSVRKKKMWGKKTLVWSLCLCSLSLAFLSACRRICQTEKRRKNKGKRRWHTVYHV